MPKPSKLIISILLIKLSCLSGSAQTWQLTWSDEFDQAELDTSHWTYQIGNGCPNLCGWGNNEWEYYTDRDTNVRVENGQLIIEAREESYMNAGYTSGRIRSKGKVDVRYGKISARIKLPIGRGIWPAFWMLPSDTAAQWPTDGEIDIMEMVGHEPETVHGTVHFGPSWPNNQWSGNSFSLSNGNFNDAFHIFSIEWSEDSIKWYVDSNLYSTKKSTDLAPHAWPFTEKFHFILNVAVGGNWPGYPDAGTVFPQQMQIDWLRIYEWQETPIDTTDTSDTTTAPTVIWQPEPARPLIYPNPTDRFVQVKFPFADIQKDEIAIYNHEGRKIHVPYRFLSKTSRFDLKDLPGGIYFLVWNSGAHKFIKQAQK